MNENYEKLVLKMFGGYTLTYAGKPIIIGRGNLTKSVQLLQLLLLNRENGISKDELVRYLYEWEDITDTNNSLNSMIWRLKTQLISAGMPKEEYISIRSGICKWCGSMPVEIDTEIFVECFKKANVSQPAEKRIYLERAVELYRGEFLPKLSGEIWVAAESMRLKKIYVQCLQLLSTILEEQQEYQRLHDIYKAAAGIYPFEGWQEKQIDVLQKIGHYNSAYRVYQDMVRFYAEELEEPPTPVMRELLRKINGKLLNSVNDFENIQRGLQEKEERNGAYYCAYPSFVDAYRMMCRMAERNGQMNSLMTCNLFYEDPSAEVDREAENKLGIAIGRSLRRGDIYTRYSGSQYLILLAAAGKKDCESIFARIEKAFYELTVCQEYWVEYEVAELIGC